MIINGTFAASDSTDLVAVALEKQGAESLKNLPARLGSLRRIDIPLLPFGLVGIDSLRKLGTNHSAHTFGPVLPAPAVETEDLDSLIEEIMKKGNGVIMTMGKGGVGKTTVAATIALKLARFGHQVTLTTTDPAAHVEAVVKDRPQSLRITRIDPAAETKRYAAEVLSEAGKGLDAKGLALLEEDLRSPCTEEIAVFRAFADTVATGEDCFVVIDTAHHQDIPFSCSMPPNPIIAKCSGGPAVARRLCGDSAPRLREASFTHIFLVTIPEVTPIHEAMQLERDLARADIRPFAWVVNRKP